MDVQNDKSAHKQGIMVISFFPPPFSPQFEFPPTNQLSPSYDSYYPERVRANMCFLQDTSSQPKASFPPATHSVSQGSITHLEESGIYVPLCTWAQGHPWLASVAEINRGERACNSSHPENMVSFAPLAPSHWWLWHWWDSNSQSPDDLTLFETIHFY